MNHSAEPTPDEKTKPNSSWKLQLGVLCGMLLLALIGMGLTQAMAKGAWEYWLFVVVIYAGLGLWRSTRKPNQDAKQVRNLIGRELGHWAVLLAFLGVVVLLEQREIISREAASDIALLLLALGCCLAGIHFDWLFLIVGFFLTVMLVTMATLEQYTVVIWVIMIFAAIAAAGVLYVKSKSNGPVVEPFE